MTTAPLTRWLIAQAPATATAAPVAPGVVAPLVVRGVEFTQGDRVWKPRIVTGFRGLELFARSERGWLDEYYGKCRELGANGVRWFLMWGNTGHGPAASGFRATYYDDLDDAIAHANAAGLYVHATMFCDQVPGSSVWMQTTDGQHDHGAQLDHVRRVVAIARKRAGVLLEVSNEDWKNGDIGATFDAGEFTGTLATRSSWPETDPPTDPQACGSWLHWSTKHCERTYDWARKGKVLFEIQHEGLGQFPAPMIPAISGEPQRIGDGTSPRCHADHAAVCEIMGAGGCLHGGFSSFDASHDSDLQNCKMTGSANAMACARAVGDVWRSTVLDPACGREPRLVRGTEYDDGECPVHHRDRYNVDSPYNEPDTGCNRTYFKHVGDRFFGLSVDPAPKWAGYQTRNDWRIAEMGGFEGNVLRLER